MKATDSSYAKNPRTALRPQGALAGAIGYVPYAAEGSGLGCKEPVAELALNVLECQDCLYPMEHEMPIVIAEELEEGQPLPGWHERYFHSDRMSFEYYDVDEGSSIHEHSHDEEEVWHVVEGTLEITLDGKKSSVSAGNAAIVPSNAKHSVVALTNAKVIIANQPVRKRIVRHS